MRPPRKDKRPDLEDEKMLGSIRNWLARRRPGRAPGASGEADVAPDPQIARSRSTGGRAIDDGDSASTTGTGRNETFVGRVAGDDLGDSGDTGAEQRAEHAEGEAVSRPESLDRRESRGAGGAHRSRPRAR